MSDNLLILFQLGPKTLDTVLAGLGLWGGCAALGWLEPVVTLDPVIEGVRILRAHRAEVALVSHGAECQGGAVHRDVGALAAGGVVAAQTCQLAGADVPVCLAEARLWVHWTVKDVAQTVPERVGATQSILRINAVDQSIAVFRRFPAADFSKSG